MCSKKEEKEWKRVYYTDTGTLPVVVSSQCMPEGVGRQGVPSRLQSGCAFRDIDKRAFVTAIGIDSPEQPGNKYKVTLKISLTKGNPKSTGSDFALITYEDKSISGALYHMNAQLDKQLVYGLTKVIFLGEKLAYEDMQPVLNYFKQNRSRSFQHGASVLAWSRLYPKIAFEVIPKCTIKNEGSTE